MTTTTHRQSRANVTRVIASSLCFDQDPPVIRNLAKAREAAGAVFDALVGAGILPADGNGAAHDVDGADMPMFPPNGLVAADPEA